MRDLDWWVKVSRVGDMGGVSGVVHVDMGWKIIHGDRNYSLFFPSNFLAHILLLINLQIYLRTTVCSRLFF